MHSPYSRLMAKLGWPAAVFYLPEFPICELEIQYCPSNMTINVAYQLRHADVTDSWGALSDPAHLFPSDDLVASLRLLAGDVSQLIKQVNDRDYMAVAAQFAREQRWKARTK
jgi:hypothetical protein